MPPKKYFRIKKRPCLRKDDERGATLLYLCREILFIRYPMNILRCNGRPRYRLLLTKGSAIRSADHIPRTDLPGSHRPGLSVKNGIRLFSASLFVGNYTN